MPRSSILMGTIHIPRGQIFRKFWPPSPHRGQTWSFGQPPLETTWSIQDTPPQHHPQKFHKYLYTFYNMLVQLHSYPKICHVTAQIENSRNHFLIWRKINFSPSDHVVILRTLPSPLVVIHGHFVNPPPPLADHVVYGWPLIKISSCVWSLFFCCCFCGWNYVKPIKNLRRVNQLVLW